MSMKQRIISNIHNTKKLHKIMVLTRLWVKWLSKQHANCAVFFCLYISYIWVLWYNFGKDGTEYEI